MKKPILTLQDFVNDIGEIPLCGCFECQKFGRKVNIKIDTRSYNKYKQAGYPKFISGHNKKKEYLFSYLPHYCSCPEHELMNLDVNSFALYEREGYPKFIKGHEHKGHPSWNLGLTKDTSEILKKQGEEHSIRMTGRDPWNKNIKCPQLSQIMKEVWERPGRKERQHEATSKSSHYNWKGGVVSLNTQIRMSPKYFDWRFQVFARDKFTCQECENSKVYVEAHHKKELSLIIKENNIKSLEESYNCSELWDLDNGITLCEECHFKTENYGRPKKSQNKI